MTQIDLQKFMLRYPGLTDVEVAGHAGCPACEVAAARQRNQAAEDLRQKLAGLSLEELAALRECVEFAVPRLQDLWQDRDYSDCPERGQQVRQVHEATLALGLKLFPNTLF